MAIDSIQSLQRQLNDVEKKVCRLWKSAYKKRYRLEIRACLTWKVSVTVTNIQQDAFFGKDKTLQMFVYLWLIVHILSSYARERKSNRNEREARSPLGPHPLPSQVFRFAQASSSPAILSARSTIDYK